MTPDEQWADILEDGEEILWQGQPDPGWHVDPTRKKSFRFSILFSVISALIFVPFFFSGEWPVYIFGAFFGGISLLLLASDTYFPARTRRYTFYTLTNKRAILGIAKPNKEPTLKFYELTGTGKYTHLPGKIGSIVFDRQYQGTRINDRKQYYAVGFMHFAESEKVWDMVQDLQKEMRSGRKRTAKS